MSKRTYLSVGVEILLLAGVAVLLLGGAGASRGVAVTAGVLTMAAIAVPSLALLMWGRSRSNTGFMAAVGGVFFGKFLAVGALILWVWYMTELPRLEFVFGLMAGWIVSFAGQAMVLRTTLKSGSSEPARRDQETKGAG